MRADHRGRTQSGAQQFGQGGARVGALRRAAQSRAERSTVESGGRAELSSRAGAEARELIARWARAGQHRSTR
eukprot:8233677-Alexandrium_andersonii.AAC.1